MIRLLPLLVSVFLLAGCSKAPSANMEPNRGILLRLTGKPGDTYRYQTDLELELELPKEVVGNAKGPHTMKVRADYESKLEKVDPDGVMHWTITTQKAMASGTGAVEAEAARLTKEQTGSIVKRKFDGLGVALDPESGQVDNPFEITFPDRPVSAGSVWSGKIKFNGVDVVTNYRLVKFEKVDGLESARIDIQFVGSDVAKILEPLELWVEVANGRPLKGLGKIRMQPEPGVVVITKVDMKRLP